MKRHGYTLRKMVLGMFLVLAIGMAHAQIGGDVLKVKVPFNFNIGTQTFPAGEYSLRSLLPHTMHLRNQSGQVLTSIATNSIESSEVSKSVKLVFNGYAGQYFLTQIWTPGDSTGRELVKSSAEIELAKKHSPGQQVALQIAPHR
ncbi:MAG TPA: hypothetical protein VMT28_06745 [Terriglobales bacterium]|nr:hypothetical protein [Terriglobales bacterium]